MGLQFLLSEEVRGMLVAGREITIGSNMMMANTIRARSGPLRPEVDHNLTTAFSILELRGSSDQLRLRQEVELGVFLAHEKHVCYRVKVCGDVGGSLALLIV